MGGMRSHRVIGGDGCALHVEEAGDPAGPPILFLHGFSQSRLSWRRQFDDGRLAGHRLVRLDLRGHGLSDRPTEGYGDGALWAADVAAVIAALGLDRPVVVGWSYGTIVTLDYLRVFGGAALGGFVMVAGSTKIGPEMLTFRGDAFLPLLGGFYSDDATESVAALSAFIRACMAEEPSAEEFCLMLGYNAMVPPFVRRGLFKRPPLDNDDLLARLDLPGLVIHGARDRVTLTTMAEHNARLWPGARLEIYPDAGHSPFLEAPERFDRDLAAFVSAARAAIATKG
jgi:pimeloyl-ACP methyl ester carboxylesterase